MAVQLNHTIAWVHDHQESAEFLTSIPRLPEPTRFGLFLFMDPNGHLLEVITRPARGN